MQLDLKILMADLFCYTNLILHIFPSLSVMQNYPCKSKNDGCTFLGTHKRQNQKILLTTQEGCKLLIKNFLKFQEFC